MGGILEAIPVSVRLFFTRRSGELKGFAHIFYIVNFLLASSFMILRLIPPLCREFVPDGSTTCTLDMRESEVMMFVGCITVIKNRGTPSWQQYMKKFLFFVKAANVFLFYRVHPAQGIFFAVLCALQMIFVPEPIYSGPNKIEYFNSLKNMEETIASDKRNTWLICFYTTWSMKCIDIAPIFAELSSKYWLPNLRFGKLDVGRFNEAAAKYYINTGTWTRQLPTLILFKDGAEAIRRPLIDSKGRVPKHEFALTSIIQDFDLINEYDACKARLGKKALQEIPDEGTGDKKRD